MIWTLLLLTMKLIPHRLTPGVHQTGIRSLIGVGNAVAPRTHSVLYLLPARARGCPSRHFGENQLSPCSIGISPLPTAHPSCLQPTLVRASTPRYRSFTLAMGSSHGFGSTTCHWTPLSDSLSLRLHAMFNLATNRNSPGHSAKGTPSPGSLARTSGSDRL